VKHVRIPEKIIFGNFLGTKLPQRLYSLQFYVDRNESRTQILQVDFLAPATEPSVLTSCSYFNNSAISRAVESVTVVTFCAQYDKTDPHSLNIFLIQTAHAV
jgi:hypothetical protein